MTKPVSLKDAFRLLNDNFTDQAAAVFAEYCKRQPDNAQAWTGLGHAHLKRMRVTEARACLERALQLDPKAPAVWHDLAAVLGLAGEFDMAIRAARNALKLRPTFAEAYYTLSGFGAHDDETDLDAIEALLKQKNLRASDRLHLHFAAGKICDDLKQTDRAFRHYKQANKARPAKYDMAAELRRFARLSETFSPGLIANKTVDPPLGEGMIFIVGMPRSGTSLLEELLARHSQIFGADERNDINDIVRTLGERSNGSGYPELMTDIDTAALAGYARTYSARMRQLSGGVPNVINKHPLNFRELGLIRTMLPAAKVLHCRRDPLDTCLSCYFQNFRSGQEYSFDLKALGRYYRYYANAMRLWHERLPGYIMNVDYADVVGDQETTLRNIIGFLGLDWQDACLGGEAAERPVMTASSWQVRQKVHTKSVGKSERYRKHLAPLEEILADEIAEYRGK